MSKPAFDPNIPFDSVKPAFDPNAPFTATSSDSQPPLTGDARNAVMGAAAKAAWNMTPMAHPTKNLPMLGAIAGSAILPGIGTAAGAGLGQIAGRMADIATGDVQPGDASSPVREALGPMAQTALSGLPEVGGVQRAAQSAAQNLGRRALGISKPILNKLKVGIPQANQAAQEMLDQGVIRPLSGARATLGRAEDVAATSGEAVGNALAKTGQHALDTNKVSEEVINQLAPKFQGGAYGTDEKIVNEIVDTIGAHGNGPIDFKSAQALKNKLKELSGANWNTDKIKASMYQRAYGIVSDALEKSVQEASGSSGSLPIVQPGSKVGDPHALFAYNDKFGKGGTDRAIYNVFGDPAHPVLKAKGWGSSLPKADLEAAGIPITGAEPRAAGMTPAGSLPQDELANYIRQKQTYGASQTAIKGLTDKANAEASNSLLSLRGAMVGGGALATGNYKEAAKALGVWEAGRRIGTGTGSAVLNYLNTSPTAGVARRALISQFVDKVIHGQN